MAGAQIFVKKFKSLDCLASIDENEKNGIVGNNGCDSV